MRSRLLLLLSCVVCGLFALPAAAQNVKVSVSADSSPGSTRLILSHSRPVVYVVESSRGKLKIRYAEPVNVQPPTARYDDRVLERYRTRDPRSITIDLGPDYDRYETFELRNPFRLILDLRAKPERQTRRSRPAPPPMPSTIIVLDPGHGGIEHGAVGPTGLREKDVTLMLARRLKRALEEANPAISVVMTRDEDRLVGLDERTSIANHNEADLFLSIHLNASPRMDANGAETYYLSTDATDDEARTLAALENRSQDSRKNGNPGKQGSLDLVLWELAQNQFLAESSTLADAVQRHLNELTGTRDRGVRQAPFRVLMGAMMPAILVEVGFISNPEDEARFYAPQYRAQVVDAISNAVQEFLLNLERFAEPRP